MGDRTVHARMANGDEIVRYDRAGKWFHERATFGREHVSLPRAVDLATRRGSDVFFDRPGGSSFDAAVRRERKALDA